MPLRVAQRESGRCERRVVNGMVKRRGVQKERLVLAVSAARFSSSLWSLLPGGV